MAARKSRKEYLSNYYETVVKPRRERLLAEGICCYCGRREGLTKEHILPRSKGGLDHDVNIRMACYSCNLSRGNRKIEDWRASLARKIAGVPVFSPAQREWLQREYGRNPYDVDASGVTFDFEGGASDWRGKLDEKR